MYTIAIIPSTKGFHWEEVFDAYKVYKESGWKIELYTVDGTQPVPDPASVENHAILSYLGLGVRSSFSPGSPIGEDLNKNLKTVQSIDQLNISSIDAIYIPGGHGCLFDVNVNERVHEKLSEAYTTNKILSAVCHGVSSFAFAKVDGVSIISGKKVIGFLDAMDGFLIKTGMLDKRYLPLPFKNEKKLKEAGAIITIPSEIGGFFNPTYYVVDFPFVTGVGPKSTTNVALKVVNLVQEKVGPF